MNAMLQRTIVSPLRALLSMGMTPERLAWSIALGLVIGINPLLGSTTLVTLAAASALRLNLVASQLGNHAMYPVELALFPLFIKLGAVLFGTAGLSFGLRTLFAEARRHPWDTTKALWSWEWHALVVWAVFAAVALPLIGFGLRPVLARMMPQQT